jgi:hypothetical protein
VGLCYGETDANGNNRNNGKSQYRGPSLRSG